MDISYYLGDSREEPLLSSLGVQFSRLWKEPVASGSLLVLDPGAKSGDTLPFMERGRGCTPPRP